MDPSSLAQNVLVSSMFTAVTIVKEIKPNLSRFSRHSPGFMEFKRFLSRCLAKFGSVRKISRVFPELKTIRHF
jgi:hypothetical protein